MQEHVKKDLKLLSSFIIVMTIVWTLVLATSVVWNVQHGKQDLLRLATNEARAYFNKDLAFRFWATSHGGVYVEVNDQTPPNPHLSHIPERDLTTPSGRQLTLMNPAYMLRQLMEQQAELYGVKSKLTSLKVFNSVNEPDDWERTALQAFEGGHEEISGLTEITGAPYLRFIRPLIIKEGCLKCHVTQGYKLGDVRGGVAVAIPMTPYWDLFDDHKTHVLIFHTMVWLMGLAMLFFINNRGKQTILTRVKLEEDRQKMHRQMALILDSLDEGVFGLDPTGNVTFVNPATLRMCGYTKEELLDQCIHAVVHHSKADGSPYPEEECPHSKTLQTGERHNSSEEVFWRKDGTSFPVEYTSSSLKNNGDNDGGVVTFRDLTSQFEKADMERQLQHVQKLESIGTLAGGIAHDFNNILSVILGYSDLALDRIPEESKAVDDIQQVMLAGNRAKDLVQQILVFSRQTEHELQPLNLQPIVKECLKLLRASIPTTITLQHNISKECGEVLGDLTQIHQVIMNLCTNAYHAMHCQAGSIDVALATVELGLGDLGGKFKLDPGTYVRLTVSDDGSGIHPTTLDKIFDPYFTTKEKGEGTGLGLAIVHGIIQDFGGAITVYSEVGEGTTFHVYLPEISPHELPQVDVAVREIPKGTERILVVDDEEAIVALSKRMLGSLGYTVIPFTSSVEALEAFAQHPHDFDLMITDMTMPKMTGMELSTKVMEIRPDLPIIICTGFSELITDKKIEMSGVKRLIMKPVIKKDLAQMIRDVFSEQ